MPFDPIEALSHGLSVARMRVNVLASNIANAETTRTAEGGPYKRRDIVQVAHTMQSKFGSMLDRVSLAQPAVAAVLADQAEPRKVFQPGHPDADKDGFVAYPNINVVSTMTDLMTASRLYQANVNAMESVQAMAREAQRIASAI